MFDDLTRYREAMGRIFDEANPRPTPEPTPEPEPTTYEDGMGRVWPMSRVHDDLAAWDAKMAAEAAEYTPF